MQRIKLLYERLPFGIFCRVLAVELARKLFLRDSSYYFSQGGEDLSCLYLLGKHRNGFYIDIGANHPIHYSNTFKLYLQGWSGILVDGNKTLMDMAGRIRKKDICIHGIVSNEKKELDFYIASDNLMSSLDPVHAGGSELKKIRLTAITIDEIIAAHIKDGRQIDVLSIDVEGHNLEVLQSINLKKNRPSLIVVEDLERGSGDITQNQFVKFFEPVQYRLAGMDHQNLFFLANEYVRPA